MKIEFTKMAGAGNDFIFLGPDYAFLRNQLGSLARSLCRRRESVGADGLIMVEKKGEEVLMHYFNSDGGEASFCGNGARCLVLFCQTKGIAAGPMRFRSRSGVHIGEVTDQGISVSMRLPALLQETSIDIEGGRYQIAVVDSGVPHAIVETDRMAQVDVEALGRKIRYHPVFGDGGVNVDFLEAGKGGNYRIRTYERGVEKETLACGSGCVACAYWLRLKRAAGDVVHLEVASGDILEVRFTAQDEVHLIGPACSVYEGQMQVEEMEVKK